MRFIPTSRQVFFARLTGFVLGVLVARLGFDVDFEATTAFFILILLWGLVVVAKVAYTNNERLNALELDKDDVL